MFKVFFSNAVDHSVLMYKDIFSEFKIPEGYEVESITMDVEKISNNSSDDNCLEDRYVFIIKGKTVLYNQCIKTSTKILPKLNKDRHPVLKKNITAYQNIIKTAIQEAINATNEDLNFLKFIKNNLIEGEDLDLKKINFKIEVKDSNEPYEKPAEIKKKLRQIIKNSYLSQEEIKEKFLIKDKE